MLILLGALLGHDHGDVARALQDLIDPPAGAWPPAFEGSALVRCAARDHQIVRIHIEIVFGIGYRRSHGGCHWPRRALGQKLEDRQRFAGRLAPHHVEHQPNLLRRHTNAALNGAEFYTGHQRAPVAFSPRAVWPRNRRVSANSPSLWPTMFSVT